jgi:hypothetical protein
MRIFRNKTRNQNEHIVIPFFDPKNPKHRECGIRNNGHVLFVFSSPAETHSKRGNIIGDMFQLLREFQFEQSQRKLKEKKKVRRKKKRERESMLGILMKSTTHKHTGGPCSHAGQADYQTEIKRGLK